MRKMKTKSQTQQSKVKRLKLVISKLVSRDLNM